ncbi:hypothetical protein BU15DRAFT_65452 [Melanogaster broomeanus]|nr:hypothetical protein BU15DRAFT_65452 [Melanogaster broomeanus]
MNSRMKAILAISLLLPSVSVSIFRSPNSQQALQVNPQISEALIDHLLAIHDDDPVKGHKDWIGCTYFYPDENKVNGEWELGEPMNVFEGHDSLVNSVGFTVMGSHCHAPSSRYGGHDILSISDSALTSLAWTPDGDHVIWGGHGPHGSITIWNSRTGEQLHT